MWFDVFFRFGGGVGGLIWVLPYSLANEGGERVTKELLIGNLSRGNDFFRKVPPAWV